MKAITIAAALLALHAAAIARAETSGPAEAAAGAQSSAAAKSSSNDSAGFSEEYQIGPSDLLEISVFQVTDMSRTVRVNAKGTITLPLIGQVQAGGLTAQQLEQGIAKKLSESFLQDPQVSVFIKEFVNKRITLQGYVKTPGVYPLSGQATLLQAIAMGSGLDPMANENMVKVFRTRRDGMRETLSFDLEAIRNGRQPDPAILSGDIIHVEKSAWRSGLKDFSETARSIFPFGLLW